MEIALKSDSPGGFKRENAVASQNGLALLASITLKNALNINNNNNNSNTKNKNNHSKNNNNKDLTSQNNKNNITHHKAPQPQHSFISSPIVASSSSSLSISAVATAVSSSSTLSTSSNSNAAAQKLHLSDQKNIFTFTTAGLQALTVTDISNIQSDTGATAVHQQKQQQQNKQLQSSTGASTIVGLSSNKRKNNHHTSLSTNHHQTSNALSAKDSNVALLEALSIKANKKQSNASIQQQHKSASSSTVTTTHSSVGNGGNKNSNSNGNGNGNNNKNSYRIPSDILDDLASRFIINVPDMELNNLIRICFQIELAHWFYLDFFCASEEEKKLQPCGIKQFALQTFEHIPFLRQHLSSIDKILEDWKNYKLSVPTYGAILISEDLNYCLLVQSYFAKSSWGFPKGKVNENEDPVHCATREVYEETGYDITELIVPNDFIEAVINYQYTRLYIVRNVSLETKFSPRTRNEIKCCDWFPIDSLPVNKNDAISKPKLGINANSFFMIMPFVKRLKKWVNDKRNGVETRRKYSSGGSPTSTSPLTTSITMTGQLKSSNKKQQKRNPNNFNEINALNNGGSAATAALSNFPCVNNTNNCSNSNSNRSKRQRHKSMGDLDGIKLNNFNNCNNNKSNCKSTNNNNNCSSTTTTTNSGGNINCININTNNNNNNNSNQKRLSKIVAAGSNVSNNINNNTNNGCNINNTNNVNNGSSLSSKRQLFQSQSQTNNLQQNGEKAISSFDLIRKEKQQIKAALAKGQNQQQNLNSNSGRQRAKSQSDKMCMQQQQQQQQQQLKSTGNGSNSKQQQRIQKQQSLIVTNSNMQNYNINSNPQNNANTNSNKNPNNNVNTKSNVNNNFNNKMTSGAYKTPTPPPLSGNNSLDLAAAAAVVIPVAHTTITAISQPVSKSGICEQQKPRPSSVSMHFPEVSAIERESTNIMATGNQMPPQFKRMSSATNLRMLKRSTSHQPTQQNQQPQPPQRQASALQFTPNFDSWTNFTFTKNFIANVFC